MLGNTGSGKSCTVAGLIRWSLEQAKHGRKDGGRPNARFIILDPNGEYASAFSDLDAVRNFRVPPAAEGVDPLVLPAWMWNSQEWSAFAHAAPGIQRPILLQALRDMRAGAALKEPSVAQIRRLLKGYATLLETRVASGPAGYTGTREASNTGRLLSNIADDVTSRATELTDAPPLKAGLEKLAKVASDTANLRHWDKDRTRRDRGFNDFGELEIRQVLKSISDSLAKLPATEVSEAVSEDAPLPFEAVDLPDHLDRIASDSPVGQAAQFVATLSMRIRMMLADRRLGPVVNPSDTSMTFEQWLTKYVGSSGAENGELAILDLSLLPSDILHLVIAVVARVVFEALQRFRKLNGNELPTVLVLEEAHSFVRRGSDEETEIPTPAQMCRQTFERIAREGRKFGLGLVLSSQRPSELSPTVLAQCNTFILHRIVNDRDQELVGKLVPDNLGGLLKDLPSLPSRQAILLGWAAEIPTLVEITELPECQRPKSSDPEFWDVWTGRKPRDIDWERITEDWTGVSLPKTETAPTKQAVAPKTTDLPDDVRS